MEQCNHSTGGVDRADSRCRCGKPWVQIVSDMREEIGSKIKKEQIEIVLYGNAISLWGKSFQRQMVIEECSELIKALCKIERGGDRLDVLDEMVDVSIMIEQLKIIFQLPDILFAQKKEMKLDRLSDRVNAEIKRREASL